MAYDGTTYTRVNISPMMSTHTNDLSVQFKTRDDDGLLLTTTNRVNDGRLKLYLDNGQGVLETNIDQQRVAIPTCFYFSRF